MRAYSRTRFVLLFGLTFSLSAGMSRAAAPAKDKGDSSHAAIPTFDGMELSGRFYARQPAGGKGEKDAVVILLHDFRHDSGGGSHKDGWDLLAARLQKEGYDVLNFDFRGFGNSTSVSPDFWRVSQNRSLRAYHQGRKPADAIYQKNFPKLYYPFLINDVAAARSYLDRKNDARELNSSNLILIGAGQGATLGAMWMAAECRRQKDKLSDRESKEFRLPSWDDPEGKDLAAAIWLSISPSLENKNVSPLVKLALKDVAREAKIPTVLVFGENDSKAKSLAKNYEFSLTGGKASDKSLTGTKTIRGTELSGSKLLSERLAIPFIVEHLARVMEDRGSKEWKKRDESKFTYTWATPWPSARNVSRTLAKVAGEKMIRAVPTSLSKLPF